MTMCDDPRQFVLALGLPIQRSADVRRLRMVWHNMLGRCYDPKYDCFALYGGRGITVCDVWRNNRAVFMQFAVANGWRCGLQIDRIDNNCGYYPGNVRFVTCRVNNLNRRDTIRLADGRPAWPVAGANGISRAAFGNRLRLGWSPDQAAGTSPPPLGRTIRLADGRPAWLVADAKGINRKTFGARIRRGWSPDQAVGLAPPPRSIRNAARS